jgi:hypothetical protein
MSKEIEQLVEDPGPIIPLDFEKLFNEKSYQIRDRESYQNFSNLFLEIA